MRTTLRLLGLCSLAATALACGAQVSATVRRSPVTAATAPPKRCRVHIDHVAKTRTAEFESARLELLAALAASKVSEGTTYVVQTDEPAYLSLRPFEHYADLDGAGARQEAVDRAVGAETLARLDTRTHGALVPPHSNELWSYRESFSYAAPGLPTLANATVGRLVEDEVMPARSDDYESAVVEEVRALAAAHHPVAVLSFVSAYGTGRHETLWLAFERADLEAALPADVLAAQARATAAADRQVVHNVSMRADLGSR